LDLQQVDDRARFVALAQPHIELVPDEVLKGMMLRELADLVRMPIVEIVKPRAREHQPRARGAPRNGPGARIADRLLSIALAYPGFFATLGQPERAGLLGLPNSLLVRVLRVIAEQPTVDQSALLAYFAGDADYDRLANLANRTFELAGEALEREFREGVTQILAAQGRENRRALVRALQEEGSAETLADYWRLKQGGN
jgi:hypothetical protein